MSSTTLRQPVIDGRTSLARLLARRAAVVRYLRHAEKRAGEGTGWHGRIWAGMVDHYHAELQNIDLLVEKRQQRTARNSADKKATAAKIRHEKSAVVA